MLSLSSPMPSRAACSAADRCTTQNTVVVRVAVSLFILSMSLLSRLLLVTDNRLLLNSHTFQVRGRAKGEAREEGEGCEEEAVWEVWMEGAELRVFTVVTGSPVIAELTTLWISKMSAANVSSVLSEEL